MADAITLRSGTKLVRLARRTIEKLAEGNEMIRSGSADEKSLNVSPEKDDEPALKVKRGVFVTLKRKDGSLRGCIGFISPSPIWDAVQSAAALAAFEDPRFKQVEKKELLDIIIEVSIMTEPSPVEGGCRKDYEKGVRVGTDGLIIFNDASSGLLLPQVPTEQGWDVCQYLEGLCSKAGLPIEALDEEGTRLMKFQCRIFRELAPGGEVVEETCRPKPRKTRHSKA